MYTLQAIAIGALMAVRVASRTYPPSISSELAAAYPTASLALYSPSAYFANHPIVLSSVEVNIESIVIANPTYFPSLARAFGITVSGAQPTGGSGDTAAMISAELASIQPTNPEFTISESVWIQNNPGAAATLASEFSSIVVNNPAYFPSLASKFGADGSAMITGAPTAIFGSSAIRTTATRNTNNPFGGIIQSQASQQQTVASSTSSSTTSSNFAQAAPTPMLGLGLTGAAVAGVAGLAAFL